MPPANAWQQYRIRRAAERRREEQRRQRALEHALADLVAGRTPNATFNLSTYPASQVLRTMLRNHADSRFLLSQPGSNEWFTLTPQHMQETAQIMENIENEDTHGGGNNGGVDGFQRYNGIPMQASSSSAAGSLVQGAGAMTVQLAPQITNRRRSAGGFFKHINLTHFDLSRYGVHHSEKEVACEDNCLFMSLKHAGFPESQWDDLRFILKQRDIPECRLKDVCEKFSCTIKLSKGDAHPRKYGKKGSTYEIGLLDTHYFVNESCSVQTFAIEHYEELKDEKDAEQIYMKNGKSWKRRKAGPKSLKVLQTLLSSKHVRPIEYNDDLLTTTFYSKFRQKSGLVLKDLNEDNFKPQEKKKSRPQQTALRFYIDYETCPAEKVTDLFDDKFATNAKHESYGLSVYHKTIWDDVAHHEWFEGENHTDNALRWIGSLVRKRTKNFKEMKDYKVILLAHNLTYDIRFIMDHVICKSILQKGSRTLSAQCMRKHLQDDRSCGPSVEGFALEFTLKDTACMIPKRLAEFNDMFKLGEDGDKEVLPYKLYTKENVSKRFCTIEEAAQVLREARKEDEIGQLIANISKFGLMRPDSTFDIMEYARFYCMRDTEVLARGYETFRGWIQETLEIDIDKQVTISSVARTYLQNRGCFEGVENVGGVAREFMKQFVVGGRVMTRENKKVHAKGKISDYDAVSLYPSAMVRVDGFLKGKPKLLTVDQLTREFLDQQTGYFVHCKVKSVATRRSFPLLTRHGEDGTRSFSNDIEEVYVDKTGLEDLVEFQGCDIEILDGIYYDQGRNDKVREVMRELFETRKKFKAEDNPIENVQKLIMNSAYGFCLMKAPEHEIQIKTRDEADLYITRNYALIHSVVEVGTNKKVVKTHKAIDDHYIPIHAGIEVLSMSKRIMNEVICLAEDMETPIFYQDTDSMHLPYDLVPALEQEFEKKYGRKLEGKDLGQFHTDFEWIGADGKPTKTHDDICSLELIANGKKCYLDILQGKNKETGKLEYNQHIRMKGVPTDCIRWTGGGDPQEIRGLYVKLLHCTQVAFDITQQGSHSVFENGRDFTVRTREEFTRKVSFKAAEILHFNF
jgi:hypothetical protein